MNKFVLLLSLVAFVFSHTVSKTGINLIKEFEGCRLTAYKDSVGVITIGYGTTNYDKDITGTTITMNTKISQATADKWLEKSLNKKYAKLVDKYNSKYKWTQNQFDALISFAYNIGNIDQLTAKGTRTKAQIAAKMPEYCHAGGKCLPGLLRRRNAEKALFLS